MSKVFHIEHSRIILGVLMTMSLLRAIPSSAQRVEARVTTDLRTLPLERQNKLTDFADKVAHYINSNAWCDDRWNTIVYLEIQLILEDMSSGAEERYRGKILIHNNYDIQFFDQRWRFAYQSGTVLTFDENAIDSFTSMLHFYLYLILGGEFDKWETLGGARFYEKARNIAEQSKFGLGRYIEGWDRRLDLVNLLLSDRHRPYREMVDYYFYGLSFVKEDNEKARKHISTAIQMLDRILANDPENEYAKKFVDSHYMEIVEMYRRAKNKDPLKTMLVLDPSRERIYRDLLSN